VHAARPYGSFGTALAGLNTPSLQVADNDNAVCLVVQKIASNIYADSTLIFVIEDDAQNGGDHIDAQRSIAFISGPYVKQKAALTGLALPTAWTFPRKI
jgi:hypothetical protein